MLIPANYEGIDFTNDTKILDVKNKPSYTYKVDWDTQTISGNIDGQAAMEQAIYKILLTERFAFLIYSWNYGFEARLVAGRGTSIVRSIIERLLKEALLSDSRVSDINKLEINKIDKRALSISFEAATIFGNIKMERNIMYG